MVPAAATPWLWSPQGQCHALAEVVQEQVGAARAHEDAMLGGHDAHDGRRRGAEGEEGLPVVHAPGANRAVVEAAEERRAAERDLDGTHLG